MKESAEGLLGLVFKIGGRVVVDRDHLALRVPDPHIRADVEARHGEIEPLVQIEAQRLAERIPRFETRLAEWDALGRRSDPDLERAPGAARRWRPGDGCIACGEKPQVPLNAVGWCWGCFWALQTVLEERERVARATSRASEDGGRGPASTLGAKRST